MKKGILVLFALLIVFLISLPFFGAGTKPKKELTLAYCPGIEDPFMRMIEKGARRKSEELGVNLTRLPVSERTTSTPSKRVRASAFRLYTALKRSIMDQSRSRVRNIREQR